MGGKKIVFVPGERVPGTSWTVLQEAESKNGERMYKCRCDCGTIRTVNAKNLKYGKSLSCGCRKPESNKGWFSIKEKNNIDLTGEMFGSVKVLEKVSGKGSMAIWKCKCMACGKIFEVVQNSLTSGATKSCGCMHRKQSSEKCKDYLGIIDGTSVSQIKSKKIFSSNTTGARGVSYNKHIGKYVVYIGFKGKLQHLGCYAKLKDAISARKIAEENIYGSFLDSYNLNRCDETTFDMLRSQHAGLHDASFIDRVEEIYSKMQTKEEIAVNSSDYLFIANQKYNYKNLSKWRKNLLNDTGILNLIGNRRIYSWDEKFEYARRYYVKFGNLRVPPQYVTEDGFALGVWITNLRNIYCGNSEGRLNEERVKKLESIGIEWRINNKLTWDEWYNLAVDYYKEHGNLRMPSKYEMNGYKLGNWVSNQKVAKRHPGGHRRITPEQIGKLEAIGIEWETRKRSHPSES